MTMYPSREDIRRSRNGVFEGSSRACASFQDGEYISINSRDSLAETFVSSFLSLKHHVSGSVEKGLSSFFDLDAYLQGCQAKIDEILEKMGQNPEDESRSVLIAELNQQFSLMCQAQMRNNQKWSLIDEELAQAVGETDAHWKRAEVFFRSKQKRGESRPLISDSRAKVNRRLANFGESSKSTSQPIARAVRPSLLPKRIGVTGLVRKPKLNNVPDFNASKFVDANSMRRSETPEKRVVVKRPKLIPGGKKWTKKMENLRNREMSEKVKEKKKAMSSPVKKRRPAALPRTPKRVMKDDSDEFSATDESKDSSDPPYSSDEPFKNRAGSEDGEKQNGSRKKNAQAEEPKYCTCRMISFGNMVGCDNDGCVIEWFHFACVGLKAKPRGKWYCPTCRDGDNCKVLKIRPPLESLLAMETLLP